MGKRNRKRGEGASVAALTGRWVILAALGVALSLVYVWQNVQLVRIGFTIKPMERELEKWQKDNEALRLANERLKNPQRIEAALARHKLGLVFPQGKDIVRLRAPRPQAPTKKEKSGSSGGTDTLLSYVRGGGGDRRPAR